jgi:hypothetical protein
MALALVRKPFLPDYDIPMFQWRTRALPGVLMCSFIPVAGTAQTVEGPSARRNAASVGSQERTAVPRTPRGAGSITGTVTSTAGAAPVARARIVLASPALSNTRVALSRADGTYEFQHLPPGAYSLTATRTGYAPQPSPAKPASPISLVEGQALQRVDFALLPAGVIAGRILDEDNNPFSGATVEALVPRTEQGQLTFAAVATTESDDRGAFRLTGLPAGEYYVSASDPAFAEVGDDTGPLHYPATYYPGATSPDRGTRVAVVPGREASEISIALKIVRPATVSGRITGPSGVPLQSAAVILTHTDAPPPQPSENGMILPDGTFQFGNVPPGAYEVRARGELVRGGSTHFATFRVLVDGSDVSNVRLELLPGATVSGALTFEGVHTRKPAALAGIRVRAPLSDGRTFGDALSGELKPDGSYEIRGVLSGGHVISLEGLPAPWALKTVTFQGQDITDAGFDASAGQRLTDLRIAVTDTPTEVSGVVRDATGRSVTDAMVLVIPLAQQFWQRTSRRFGLLHSDAQGRFSTRGLPEGEYRVVAVADLDESEARRVTTLERLADNGTPLTLKDREQRVLDLSLTSAVTPRVSTR